MAGLPDVPGGLVPTGGRPGVGVLLPIPGTGVPALEPVPGVPPPPGCCATAEPMASMAPTMIVMR
jgi:hypothetical protein